MSSGLTKTGPATIHQNLATNMVQQNPLQKLCSYFTRMEKEQMPQESKGQYGKRVMEAIRKGPCLWLSCSTEFAPKINTSQREDSQHTLEKETPHYVRSATLHRLNAMDSSQLSDPPASLLTSQRAARAPATPHWVQRMGSEES